MTRKVVCVSSLAVILVAGVAARASAQVDSQDILGFENTAGWTIATSAAPPGSSVLLTPIRTEGSAAFTIASPAANLLKIVSQPVSSTAAGLTGIGESGAQFRLDLIIPTQQGNQHNAGGIQLFVTSASRGLSKVAVAQVSFNALPTGTYTTVRFPIPAAVRNALNGSFNDLTFEFDISSPGRITGPYFLDHLRVRALVLDSDEPPPGYGSSVDLLVKGEIADAKSFAAGAVQVPGDLMLMLPTNTGSPRLQLDLGHDGASSFVCLYDLDPADNTNKHFVLTSCTNGNLAGDLVGASWARLAILNGNGTGKIRAQLALNPVGDLFGRGIIPPMPTFWGDFETCKPVTASVPTATPVTLSDSCAEQTAQASQIVSNYFDQVGASLQDWVVTPSPLFARRLGNGSPHDNLTGPPPPNDPPFDVSGHMNDGGDWDAYWRLHGNLEAFGIDDTDRGQTHFEANLGAHAVIWGHDVAVLDVRAILKTDTGQTNPSPIPSSATGSLETYVFGNLIDTYNADATTDFNVNWYESDEQTIAVVPIWIFKLTLKAGYTLGLTATGGVSTEGPNFSFKPSASLDAHVSGGVSIGIASGSVNAKVNLIKVDTPLKLNAKFTGNANPAVCANTLTYKLDGDVVYSSGGGSIKLVAKFGECPVCYKKSWKIYDWDPLLTVGPLDLFTFEETKDFKLPTSQCAATPLIVTIVSPKPNAIVPVNDSQFFSGNAQSTIGSILACKVLKWTFMPGANASPGGFTAYPKAEGCSFTATFDPPLNGASTANWTVRLDASDVFTDKFGRPITKTGTTSVPFTVRDLPTGVYIRTIVDVDAPDDVRTIDPGAPTVLFPNGVSSTPSTRYFKIAGLVAGLSGTTSSYSATNGTIVTTTGPDLSKPTADWQLTALPSTDGSYYYYPDTVITLTTTTPGGQTYTSTLTVQFAVVK